MSGISVVVPTFNRSAFIGATLDAILAQTLRPLEILVVDDGSTDDTREVCARYGDDVRYLRQENAGVSAARNHGMRLARGEWVAFCDSDDLWHPQKLAVELAFTAAAGARWCITGCRLIDPSGAPRAGSASGFENAFPVFAELATSADEHFARWLLPIEVAVEGRRVRGYAGDAFGMLFEGNVVLPSSVLVARDLLREAGEFDERFRAAEDTEFFHRVAARSPIAIVMDRLMDYRVGHPSLVSTSDAARLIEVALHSLERAASLRPLSGAEERARASGRRRLLSRLAYTRLTSFDGPGARESLRAARHEGALELGDRAVLLASYLPASLLRGLHRAKRALRGASDRT